MRASHRRARWTTPPGPGSRSSRRPTRPWDLASVAHLHRRAGFAAPWAVLERDLRDGPAASIERLLTGEAKSADGTPAAEFESTLDAMAAQLGALRRSGADPGHLAVPDDLHAASAPRADDPVLAQPLRHLDRQGPEPAPDAAAERPAPRRRPWATSAPCLRRSARTRPC